MLTAMTQESKKLLQNDLRLPEYALLLLETYGMRTLEDLTELTIEVIQEIVECVRASAFGDIDFTSKSVKAQYLGGNYSDVKTFDFKPMDRKKLNRVGELAEKELQRLNVVKEKGLMNKRSKKNVENVSSEVSSPKSSTQISTDSYPSSSSSALATVETSDVST